MFNFTVVYLPDSVGGDILTIRDNRKNLLIYNEKFYVNNVEIPVPSEQFIRISVENQDLSDFMSGAVNLNNVNVRVVDGVVYRDVNNKSTENLRTSVKYRFRLLRDTDWTQSDDTTDDDLLESFTGKTKTSGTGGKNAWASYRQSLRILVNNPRWPNLLSSDWPIPPDTDLLSIPYKPQ